MWIDLFLSPLPLNVQNAGVHGSTVFKRLSNRALAAVGGKCWCGPSGRADLKEIQKPWVFGGVLSPISFAAERNGAAGGKKAVGGRYHERRGAGSALILHTSGKFLLFPLFSWSETFPTSGAEFARKWQSLTYMSGMLTTSEFLFDFISTKFMKMVLP